MTDHIAFDLTRLFIGPITTTPRGIDRVDLGYARHFFEHWNGDCVGVLPTSWGIRWFNRDRSMNVIKFIENFWGETYEAHTDPAYAWVRARLRGERPSVPLKTSGRLRRVSYPDLSALPGNTALHSDSRSARCREARFISTRDRSR
jgi:hypothetical protein